MKMKGLLFKELYLGRKNYLLMLTIWFMLSVLGILIRLSMLYGNMAKMPAEDLANSEKWLLCIFIYAPAVIILISAMLNFDSVFADFATKWSSFLYTTPISEYRYVGTRYILKSILFVVAIGLSFLNASILCTLNDKPLDTKTVGIMLIIALLLTVLSVIGEQLAYKYKEKAKTQNRLALLCVIVYMVIMGGLLLWLKFYMNAHPEAKESDDVFVLLEAMLGEINLTINIDTVVVICPFAIIAVLAAGYFLTVKAMKRREN